MSSKLYEKDAQIFNINTELIKEQTKKSEL
jgi:hypothetical protein